LIHSEHLLISPYLTQYINSIIINWTDEMEMTLNESSSVIEALVTLTSNEDSNKSSTEAVDDEDI